MLGRTVKIMLVGVMLLALTAGVALAALTAGGEVLEGTTITMTRAP